MQHAAGFGADGKAGFVVTLFEYALSRDASQTGACPTGLDERSAQYR